MKVTRRLPVDQRYAETGKFAEMRLFRFGERSSLAAVLFGLFEQLRLPDFQSLRANLCREVEENTAVRNKRILSFLLEPKVRTECMFAAWNYDELVLDAVVEAVGQLGGRGDVVTALRRKFPFQLFTTGKEPTNCMSMPTIYTDKAENGAVLLLYTGRTMDSYIVTKCRHLYVKASLISIEEALSCTVEGCQQPIEMDILKGTNKGSVLPSRIYFDLVTNQEKDPLRKYYRDTSPDTKCQYCEVRNGSCECSARCHICIECALVAYCSQGYACRCPVCGERLSKELCLFLGEELPRRVRWTQLPHSYTSCDYCRQAVTIGEVREIIQGARLKFACPNCYRKVRNPSDFTPLPSPKPLGDIPIYIPPALDYPEPHRYGRHSSQILSPSAQSPLSPSHKRSQSSPPRRETIKQPPVGDFIENCQICHRLTSCFAVMRALRHSCWVCDDCIYAFYDSKWVPTCPICHVYVGNSAFNAIKTWINTLNSQRKMNLPVACSLCSLSKPLKTALKSSRLSHLCSLCDTCLLSSLPLSICPKCCQPYSPQDRAIVARLQGRVERGKLLICSDCRGKVNQSQPSCPKACLCSRCLLQNYVFTNSTKCPHCKSTLKGQFPETVVCTGCARPLIIREESVNTVSGVCDKACILCCFCIQITNLEAFCTVCQSAVESIELKHIAKWQKSFKLGCYCGKDTGAKVKIPCGCKIHCDCWAGLCSCRLCGHKYQKQQPNRRLTSYLT